MFMPNSEKPVRLRIMAVALLVLAMLSAFCLSPLPLPAGQYTFSDLPQGDPAYPFVKYLAADGLINGYPDGTFRPEGRITRAEAAALLVKAAGLNIQSPAAPSFSDVGPGHWARGVVEAAAGAGLVSGYPDGTFRPDGPVTRAETAALLLRLTKAPLPAVNLPKEVQDVGAGHWAGRQIAAALAAGLLGMAGENSFGPDQAATRSQVARGLAVMINISPERVKVPLLGTLVPVKGEVSLKEPGGEFRSIKAETPCGAGSAVKTGPGAVADLRFPDGSGLRLEENTDLAIVESRGQATILRDGTPGAAVDFLKLELAGGRIFGALASGYISGREKENTVGPTASSGVKSLPLLAAASKWPTAGILLAQESGAAGESPWWQQPYEERVRVEVDMPWGVAGIRGTFWMNWVLPGGQTTSVITGSARLTAAGRTVGIRAGQSSGIISQGAPPSPPARMSQGEQRAWAEVRSWVEERAAQIRNSLPVIAPPRPSGDPAPPLEQIIRDYMESVSGVMPPAVTSVGPAGGAVTITFSEEIMKGGSFGGIALRDATGAAVPFSISLEGRNITLVPAQPLQNSAPASGIISVTFNMDMSAVGSVAVRLTAGEDSRVIPARVSGRKLEADYSGLAPNTAYTVAIPAGTLRSTDFGTLNEEIVWTFTTGPGQ